MAKLRLNSVEDYEHLCNVRLAKEKYPIAYENKVQELVEQGLPRIDAEKCVNDMVIELELYYHKEYGLFAVESDAVESGTIYSPYNGELCEEPKVVA